MPRPGHTARDRPMAPGSPPTFGVSAEGQPLRTGEGEAAAPTTEQQAQPWRTAANRMIGFLRGDELQNLFGKVPKGKKRRSTTPSRDRRLLARKAKKRSMPPKPKYRVLRG